MASEQGKRDSGSLVQTIDDKESQPNTELHQSQSMKRLHKPSERPLSTVAPSKMSLRRPNPPHSSSSSSSSASSSSITKKLTIPLSTPPNSQGSAPPTPTDPSPRALESPSSTTSSSSSTNQMTTPPRPYRLYAPTCTRVMTPILIIILPLLSIVFGALVTCSERPLFGEHKFSLSTLGGPITCSHCFIAPGALYTALAIVAVICVWLATVIPSLELHFSQIVDSTIARYSQHVNATVQSRQLYKEVRRTVIL